MKHLKPVQAMALSVAASLCAIPAFAVAQETLIGFDDPAGLSQIYDSARSTFVVNQPYKEDGMVFEINVNPPDPQLGPKLIDHFHLMYEREIDPLLLTKLPHPENEPRLLATMLPGNVVQMTYHPNGIEAPQPFNIKRLRVLSNRLNVGVKSAFGYICVFNNLTAGYDWTLVGNECTTNLVRVTFETPPKVPNFSIDDVVFEPFPSAPGAASALSHYGGASRPSRADQPFIDPLTLMAFIGFDKFPPLIDIKPGQKVNIIDVANDKILGVAVLTSRGFDAADVDPHSITFGNTGARPLTFDGHTGYLKDVDGDGDRDLLVYFRTANLGIQCEDNYLSLKGRAHGESFIGFDFTRIKHCTQDMDGSMD